MQGKSEKKMIILGWWFGMGALIQSTVNAIWLSRKLGFRPLIHWGRSCPYNTGDGNDVYARYFSTPEVFSQWEPCIFTGVSFPPVFKGKIPEGLSIHEIDRLARGIDTYGEHSWRREDREHLTKADVAILYQYLTSELAWEMAYGLGAVVNMEKLNHERSLIFNEYFQPINELKDFAEAFWNGNFRHKENVFGMHIRGADKIIESGLPDTKKYFKKFILENRKNRFEEIFLATDSEKAKKQLESKFGKKYRITSQNYIRSKGVHGIHNKSGGAFENGKDMVVDIEILSRCKTVMAFRKSQINWWLERKQNQSGFKLISIDADFVDWMKTGIKVLTLRDLKKFISFVREAKKMFLGKVP